MMNHPYTRARKQRSASSFYNLQAPWVPFAIRKQSKKAEE